MAVSFLAGSPEAAILERFSEEGWEKFDSRGP
jgi:hypothetical protein